MEKFFYGVIFTLGVQAFGVFILYKILECTMRYRVGFLGEHFFVEGKRLLEKIFEEKKTEEKDEKKDDK